MKEVEEEEEEEVAGCRSTANSGTRARLGPLNDSTGSGGTERGRESR